jgi:hypothetical protein
MAKLSISQAWDETRAVLARDGKLIGTVALALFVLPGLVLGVVTPAKPQPGAWMLVGFVAVLVTLVGQLAIIRLSIEPHVSVAEAIGHGARRLLPYILSILMWAVPFLLLGSLLSTMVGKDVEHPNGGAVLGLAVLTAIGVFVGVRLVLAAAVASAEPVGPLAILRRSWDLTRGNWWRLFAFLILFVGAAFVLIIAAGTMMGLIARAVFGDVSALSVGGLLLAIIAQLVSAFVSVILFVMLARIYAQRAGRAEAEVGVPSSGI